MPILLDLFLSFAKIGLFTFGGGYAMLSLIENTCVEKKKWITQEEMMNITVIAESTPGPVAINCATYVGYKQKKMLGALVSMLGMILPSFVIIYLISMFLDRFLEITWVANAFQGIKKQFPAGFIFIHADFLCNNALFFIYSFLCKIWVLNEIQQNFQRRIEIFRTHE